MYNSELNWSEFHIFLGRLKLFLDFLGSPILPHYSLVSGDLGALPFGAEASGVAAPAAGAAAPPSFASAGAPGPPAVGLNVTFFTPTAPPFLPVVRVH
jgi:hypothetical protein